MDEINLMRSFIAACDSLEDEWLVTEIPPEEDKPEIDILAELESLKFKLTAYECHETGDLALGFDRGLVMANQMIEILINKLRTAND